MIEDWTFGKRIGTGFAIAGIVVVVLSAVGFSSTQRLIENNHWVEHTHEVRRTLSDLLSVVKDAESGARGYALTGDGAFLEPYRAALNEVGRTVRHVQTLTADNPSQQRRIEALGPMVDARLAEATRLVGVREKDGLEPATRVVAGGEGKRLMALVRTGVGEMDREEEHLLELRARDAEAAAASTQAVLVGGSVLGLITVLLTSWFIVRQLTQQIGTAVHQVQSSSTELQAAANQQASGAKEQSQAMTEVSTTLSELLATSRQIAESAKRVTQIAEQTAKGAQTGNLTVERAHQSITSIRRQVDAIVAHMLELGRKSQQIGSVLDIVSELAEQTNILAINATIEAADAGDSGRRFAVVADEIRKLADRVSGSAKEIRALVEDVRSSVNTTVMATETGSKAVDAGSAQFAEVAVAFKDIGGLVLIATEAAREIELSTKQQSSAVEQVNVAIGSIAQTTRETEASTGQTLSTATQLSSLSRALHRIIQPQGV